MTTEGNESSKSTIFTMLAAKPEFIGGDDESKRRWGPEIRV